MHRRVCSEWSCCVSSWWLSDPLSRVALRWRYVSGCHIYGVLRLRALLTQHDHCESDVQLCTAGSVVSGHVVCRGGGCLTHFLEWHFGGDTPQGATSVASSYIYCTLAMLSPRYCFPFRYCCSRSNNTRWTRRQLRVLHTVPASKPPAAFRETDT
ncbi:hypothetical protein J6590_033040 [Homalodisca vitripennis]|nr:hypothetical protein J6590_033040 [Homalodisca vitripennis]